MDDNKEKTQHQEADATLADSGKAPTQDSGGDQNPSAVEKPTPSTSGQRPPLAPRSSQESTATTTTLPPYTERPAQPPSYNSSTNTDTTPAPRLNLTGTPLPLGATGPRPSSGPNAAAVSAMMSTSSSSNDRMHTRGAKKEAGYWDENPTLKQKLKESEGSTRTWNYFGADIEQYGGPFKRFGRKK